ncbi:Hemolysin-type calcium-binding repeat-containing protein [Sulfitobacter brevis]|uniref:Hemolysin-type calcium-binding repeat-containing protein n=1 Tax=Sulfitobacter brevis TaxID=74348 RepID=A0A1I2FTD9_9RHOB|nr:calcium-binding protein [Sulfitobacter brevis]SFF08575.1 Hemolysin-type calcium-binding repeat-containing protein [Sulfitobacter brevis]
MPVYSAASGDPFVINTTQTGRQSDPDIAVLSNGNYVIVWNSPGQDDPNAFSDGVFGRVFTANGLPLGDEFQVNDVTDNFQRAAQVVAGNNGGFTVFWESFVADNRGGIVGRSFASDGSAAGAEFAVNTTTNSIQRSVVATVLNNGSIATAWESQGQDGSQGGIAARITGTGGGGEDDFIVNTTLPLNQTAPAIAALADGSFVVSWTGELPRVGATPQFETYAQRVSAAGALIGDEILVNTTSIGGQFNSDIAAVAGGGFIVTWQSNFLTNRAINAQLYDQNGAPVGGEVLVNTHGSPATDAPSVIGTPDGGYLISWRSGGVHTNPDLPGGHYAQRFDAGGNRVSEEFRISTQINGNPAQARLAVTITGDIIATWQHGGPAGDGNGGIRAQSIVTAGEVTGTNEADFLRGAHLGDRIEGLAGNDTIYGFDGPDTIFGDAGDDLIFTGSGGNFVGGGSGNDVIRGGSGNDTIYGGVGSNDVSGGAGNDLLRMSTGADTVYGGLGDDNIGGGAGNDLIIDGAGTNIIYGGAGSDTVQGGSGTDSIYGGGNGANRLFGNAGNDLVVGGAGNDLIGGGVGNDALYGSTGNDTIYAGDGNDFIGAGAGNDAIIAGVGSNRIYGGAGNDTVYAGVGRDVITGGPGVDHFVFNSAAQIGLGAGRDVITDFTSGVDKINLDLLDAQFNGASGLIGNGQSSFYYYAASGLLIGDSDGDGSADWALEMSGAPSVAVDDFIL